MILNKTKFHRERYQIVKGSMDSYGEEFGHPNYHYEIVNGIDRGNGYQGYMSVSYFLKNEYGYIPKEAIENCKRFLKRKGYKL